MSLRNFSCVVFIVHIKVKMKKLLKVHLDIDVQPNVSTPLIDASYEFEELCESNSKDLIDLGKIKISLWP